MKSIRSRILIWLLVLFIVSWVAIAVAIYNQTHHEVEEIFDAELAQAAGVLSQIHLLHEFKDSSARTLGHEVYGHRYEKKIAFQIWRDDQLMLRSANASAAPMTSAQGFTDQQIDGQLWRVFLYPLKDGNQRVIVAEKYEVRNELINEIMQDVLMPLPVALPVLVILIWIGITRGLAPMRKITNQVQLRSPGNLEPVNNRTDIPLEIKPLIHALNELFGRLKQAFEHERRFTADAAHELRTPLASLKTQAQVALRATDEQQRLHALEQINKSVDRTTHLVEQLLTLARLDPDSAQDMMTRVDLVNLSQEVLAAGEEQAHAKDISLELENEQRCHIDGNPVALTILLRNLVDNAIRYTPTQGRVMVSVECEERGATVLRVLDTGPGISQPERERIFERFYRGGDQQHVSGSGLGLSIVKRIAELHRAELELLPGEQGRGLCVQITFPRMPGR